MRTNEEYKLLEYAHKIKSYCASRIDCNGCIFKQSYGICNLTDGESMGNDYFMPADWFEKRTEVENESTL